MNGHVYAAYPPLFRVTTKKNEYIYLKDQQALDEYIANHNNVKDIGRNKGLGESSSEELYDSLLNPKTRNVEQLIVTDKEQVEKMLKDLYGRAVNPRVQFLNKYGEEAKAEYE